MKKYTIRAIIACVLTLVLALLMVSIRLWASEPSDTATRVIGTLLLVSVPVMSYYTVKAAASRSGDKKREE